MPALLNLLDVHLAFGGPAILDGVNFQIEAGERVCLVGRNGTGKSTLMKVIMGEMKPDTGDVFRPAGALYARLTQEVPVEQQGNVHDIVASGLRPNDDHHEEDWQRDVRVEDLIHQVGVPPTQEFSTLSGGLKRRVLLARALAGQPDLLLLDEPTNHLDLDMREALALALQSFVGALVLVSHDRHLIASVCDQLWRVSDGGVAEFDGDLDDYARWLSRRERDYNRALEATPTKAERAPAKPPEPAPGRPLRGRERPLRQALERAETRVESLHARLAAIAERLADGALYRDSGKQSLQELLSEQQSLRQQLDEAEESWLAAAAALEGPT